MSNHSFSRIGQWQKSRFPSIKTGIKKKFWKELDLLYLGYSQLLKILKLFFGYYSFFIMTQTVLNLHKCWISFSVFELPFNFPSLIPNSSSSEFFGAAVYGMKLIKMKGCSLKKELKVVTVIWGVYIIKGHFMWHFEFQ